jgi:hypothetical protein
MASFQYAVGKPASNEIPLYMNIFIFHTDLLDKKNYCTVHAPCIYDPNNKSQIQATHVYYTAGK